MSNIQTTHQDTSALFKGLVNHHAGEVEWPAYADARRQLDEHPDERLEQSLNRKRAHAMRYLGSVRRFGGGAYNRTEPRVFTMQFVSELGQENAARRASRNPWLESMLLPAASDGSDHAIATHGANVLPFGPQVTPNAHRV